MKSLRALFLLLAWCLSSDLRSSKAQTFRADVFRVEPPSEAAARRLFAKATDNFNSARWNEALEFYQKVLEHESHYRGSALFNIGLILERSDELERAVETYHDAIRAADGVESAAYTRIGLNHGRSGEIALALEAFDASLKLDKENFMAKRNRIAALRFLDRQGENQHPCINTGEQLASLLRARYGGGD